MYNEMFQPGQPSILSALPKILWQPRLLDEDVSSLISRKGIDKVVEQAKGLPTRRPDLRSIVDYEEMKREPCQNGHDGVESERNAITGLLRMTMGVSCLMHVPGWFSSRLVERVQSTANVQVTKQIAIGAFLWAAVNRSRAACKLDPIELHVPTSLRYRLGLPEGLLGSPVFAPMLSPAYDGDLTGQDTVKLAVKMTEVLAKYDEDAMLAVVHQASMRDSPIKLPLPKRESMQLTSAMLPASGKLAFGPFSPVFVSPLMPVDNLFVLLGGLDSAGAVGSTWQEEGIDAFFQLPEQVLEAMMADSELSSFEMTAADI